MGPFISSNNVRKVIEVNDFILGTMAGGAADCQFWESYVAMQCRISELRNGEKATVAMASNMLVVQEDLKHSLCARRASLHVTSHIIMAGISLLESNIKLAKQSFRCLAVLAVGLGEDDISMWQSALRLLPLHQQLLHGNRLCVQATLLTLSSKARSSLVGLPCLQRSA